MKNLFRMICAAAVLFAIAMFLPETAQAVPNMPSSVIPTPSEGGMTIRRTAYSAEDLEKDMKGYCWSWDASEQTLTLSNWNITDESSFMGYIVIDRFATVNFKGTNNEYAMIYSSKGLNVTGTARTSACTFDNEGSGDLIFSDAGSIEGTIRNYSGDVVFMNSITRNLSYDTIIYTETGDIYIDNSQISAEYIACGNNLYISNSVVLTCATRDFNDLYASNTLNATDSILAYYYMSGEKGENIASSVALFERDATVKYSGTKYYYEDRYALINDVVLNQSFTLPDAGLSDGYAIAKGKKLTISSGCHIQFDDALLVDGKIRGDGTACYGDGSNLKGFYMSWPDTVLPGSVIPLTITPNPSTASVSIQWNSSHPELISFDKNNVLTLKSEAIDHVGETVTLYAHSLYVFIKTYYVTFKITAEPSKDAWILPADLKVIDTEAFANLDVQQVVIPNGTTTIGSRAFADCTNLKVIFIPDSVTDIAEDAFEGSTDVAFVCPSDNTAAQFAATHNIPFVAE